MGPKITLARKSGKAGFDNVLRLIMKRAAYVGVPANTKQRDQALQDVALKLAKKKGKRARTKLTRALDQSGSDINNAELLFLITKGSPARHIPATPILEPAIELPENRAIISRELAASAKSILDGSSTESDKYLKRAALAGQNAARKYFTDPRNGWPPNAPSTIKRKGSARRNIDFGILRSAIIGITRVE